METLTSGSEGAGSQQWLPATRLNNEPQFSIDPSGLIPPGAAGDRIFDRNLKWKYENGKGSYAHPDEPFCLCKDLKEHFLEWYTTEKKQLRTWIGRVEKHRPPKHLPTRLVTRTGRGRLTAGFEITTREFVLPEGWQWDVPIVLQHYHTLGARYGIRHLSGTQATYTSDGKIITGGFAAGSADKVPPSKDPWEHYNQDVAPYETAGILDKCFRTTKYRRMYYEVRPVILPKNTPKNWNVVGGW